MRVVLLANPRARGGRGSDAASRTVALLEAAGIRPSVLQATSRAEASARLRAALALSRPCDTISRDCVTRSREGGGGPGAGPDAVVVVGGDGTVNLAIQELAGSGVPLLPVPAGTGNDLALGITGRDSAVEALLDGTTRTIDLARVSDDHGGSLLYATVLASGFDARVNDRANRLRWPRGRARYTVSLLIEFARLRSVPFDIALESADGTVLRRRGDLIMATVGNGPVYGGGIPICPAADLDDGLLDVTLVHPLRRSRLARLLPHVYRGTHPGLDEVETHRVRRVRLDSPGATAYADGDPIGGLPLTIEPVPAALVVFTPNRSIQ